MRTAVVERIIGPQRCPHPNPQTCEYVTLQSKKDFEDVIKLKHLKWRNYCGLSGWDQCNHKGSCKRKAGMLKLEGGRCKAEAEIEIICFEVQGQDHELKNAHVLWKLEKVRNRFSLRHSRRNTALPAL